MKTPFSTTAATTFLLLFFNVCLFSQPTWEYFTSNLRLTNVAARGNDILTSSSDSYGFYHLDTFGNSTHYTTQNSDVPFFAIKCVGIDAQGGWWVIQYKPFVYTDGVARFDGATWTEWNLTDLGLLPPYTAILGIETLDDGRVFLSTNHGAAVYENGSWSVVDTSNSGLPSNEIRDITTDNNGNTYFATDAGLAVWDGNLWTVHNATSTGMNFTFNDCTGVAVEPTGTLWVTSSLNRLIKYENGVWTSYTATALGLPSSIGIPKDVLFDTQGRQWVSYSKGVAVRVDSDWMYTSDTIMGCIGSFSPTLTFAYNRLAQDGSGRVWSVLCGLNRFVGPTEWVSVPHTDIALPNGQIWDLTQDTSGVMWFAGQGGITRKNGDAWELFSPEDLGISGTDVYTAHGDVNGNIWFSGAMGAILRFDGSSWTVFDTLSTVSPGFSADCISSGPDGTVWFALSSQTANSARLARYQNGNWTFFKVNDTPVLANNHHITSIVVYEDGTAWFFSDVHLLRYDGTVWTSFDPMDAGLDYSLLRRMVRGPDNALWIASNAGVLRFDGATWSTITAENSDIPTNNIQAIAFDALGGMYLSVEYNPSLGVLSNGVWTSLIPTGFEESYYRFPWQFYTDRDDRLWYSIYENAGIMMYDPMLVIAVPDVQKAATGLYVFPNPATEAVTVVWNNFIGEGVRVRLLDPTGKVILENATIQGSQQMTIALPASLPTGIYMVEVTDGFGQRVIGRFVRM
ncbi:MAG: T9SS type A sorting domain-containing protein [Saprospiraceae bacterium]|nr:T9SS type A sorting domain-containing protein [Saprospiraceae bacterium]